MLASTQRLSIGRKWPAERARCPPRWTSTGGQRPAPTCNRALGRDFSIRPFLNLQLYLSCPCPSIMHDIVSDARETRIEKSRQYWEKYHFWVDAKKRSATQNIPCLARISCCWALYGVITAMSRGAHLCRSRAAQAATTDRASPTFFKET